MAEKAVSLERLKRYFAKEKEVFAAKSHTHSDATTSSHGMMSAADKTKLNGIAAGANDYSHPTSSGNKHIPAGGASGQILRWASDGTAQWGNDNNTTYSAMKGASATANGSTGLVPAPTMGNQGKYLRADGTWQTPPDTNTTYGTATQSANGLMSAADKKKLDNLALTLFPVGSVVITHTNTNPGTYIGGTWVAYAPGRVLVGVGTGNDGSKSVTFGANSAAGQYQHNHGYSLRYNEYFATANKIQAFYAKRKDSDSFWYEPGKTGTTANAAHTTTNSSAVSTTDTYTVIGATDYNPTTDLIPYQTAYFWRRTA